MNCFYISLENQIRRQNEIEHCFSKFCSKQWTLNKIDAFSPEDINVINADGIITPPEKACFLSHKEAIRQNINLGNHFAILEDDTLLGKNTSKIIDKIMSQIGLNKDWDMIFTDVGIFDVGMISRLAAANIELKSMRSVQLINLKNISYYGANSYIISKYSANKIYQILESETVLNEHFDHFIRANIDNGRIKALFVFPFVTTVSSSSESSSIQSLEKTKRDIIWNYFRRISWYDAEPEIGKHIETAFKTTEYPSSAYGLLLGSLLHISALHQNEHKPLNKLTVIEPVVEISNMEE